MLSQRTLSSAKPVLWLRNPVAKLAALPMLLVSVGVFLGFSFWTILHSFTGSRLLPNWRFVGLDQYEKLWDTPRWIASVSNIMLYSAGVLILSIGLGFLLAVLLDQKIRAESTLRTIFLYPYALSFVVIGLAWQWLLNPEFGFQHVIRSLGWHSFNFDPLYNPEMVMYAVMLAGLWHGTGFVMVIMLAGLRGIDENIWKAVKVEGIAPWRVYLFIIIPMLRPVFITVTVMILAGIVKLYDLVVALTNGGPGSASEVPAKYVVDAMFLKQNLGQGFAASTMMLLAVLLLFVPGLLFKLTMRLRRGQ